MKTWQTLGLATAVIVMVGFGPLLSVSSAEEEKNVEQMIAEAKTPADHQAIANFYEAEAQAAHQKQAQHERMKAAYQSRYPTKRAAMMPHCESIIKKYKDIAEDYTALAKLHAEMATPPSAP